MLTNSRPSLQTTSDIRTFESVAAVDVVADAVEQVATSRRCLRAFHDAAVAVVVEKSCPTT